MAWAVRVASAVIIGVCAVVAQTTGVPDIPLLIIAGTGAVLGVLAPPLADAVEKRARERRQQEEGLSALVSAGPRPVAELDPYTSLGVHPSWIAERHRRGRPRPPYISRRVDSEIESALRSRDLTIVSGPSTGGKTRSLYEALLRTFPSATVVAPVRPSGRSDLLTTIVSHMSHRRVGPWVLWLDDIQFYLESRALDMRLLEQLRSEEVRIVGTIGNDALEGLRDLARNEREGSVNEVGREIQRVLDAADSIPFIEPRPVDDAERAEAKVLYPGEDFSAGIGAHLVGGPRMVERFEAGKSLCPMGVAVLCAVIDWRRAGIERPVPPDVLKEIFGLYLDDLGSRGPDGPDDYSVGVEWGLEEVIPTVALLRTPEGKDGGFTVSDFLVAYRDGEVMEGRGQAPIPQKMWEAVARHATLAESGAVAYTAVVRVGTQRGRQIVHSMIASAGGTSPMSMLFLGQIEVNSGSLPIAIELFRKVLDLGHPAASPSAGYMLGKIFKAQGNAGAARPAYEAALRSRNRAEAGDAAYNLAQIALAEGDLSRALELYERAIEVNAQGTHFFTAWATTRLIELLDERGDSRNVERVFKKALSITESSAAHDEGLGLLRLGDELDSGGRPDMAVRAYERLLDSPKASGCHSEAAFKCGEILKRGKSLARAGHFYEKAIAAESDSLFVVWAAIALGKMFSGRRASARAEALYERILKRASERNDAMGMAMALELSKGLMDSDQSKIARRASELVIQMDAGGAGGARATAALSLAEMALEDDDLAQAEKLLRVATTEIDGPASPRAIVPLTSLLLQQGREQEAAEVYERWLRRASRDAVETAGNIFAQEDRPLEARRAYERAIQMEPDPRRSSFQGEMAVAKYLADEDLFEEAEALLRRVIGTATYPFTAAAAAQQLAELLEETDDLDGAITEYRRATNLLYVFNGGVAVVPLARCLRKAGRGIEAMDAYERALTVGSGDVAAEYLSLARDIDEEGRGKRFLEEVLKKGEPSLRAWRAEQIADALADEEDSDLRLSALRAVIETGEPERAGRAALRLGGMGEGLSPEQASENAVSAGDPLIAAWARVGLGLRQQKRRDWHAATESFRWVQSCGVESVAPWGPFLVGECLERQGDSRGATAEYRVAAKSKGHPAAEVAESILSGEFSGEPLSLPDEVMQALRDRGWFDEDE